MIDGFDLSHFDKPDFDVLGCCYKESVTMILSLAKDLKEIRENSNALQGPQSTQSNSDKKNLSFYVIE